jgi:hypothetical protein
MFRQGFGLFGLAAVLACAVASWIPFAAAAPLEDDGEWEITAESQAAVDRGLRWLAANQGEEGNWKTDDLGLVAMGGLAFLSAGHMPGIGEYGKACEKALSFVAKNAKPSGLLNIAGSQRDMYNHGLSTFVLGQAYGMTGDERIGKALDRALKLIAKTQGPKGGWDYVARPGDHDLSLAVMQAKALRSAGDSGFEIPPSVIEKAIQRIRDRYQPKGGNRSMPEAELRKLPGQFTYMEGGNGPTVAMAAAGVVCLQEFGQYDDWRIAKSMERVNRAIAELKPKRVHDGNLPFDAYTLKYVGQALYQVGGPGWRQHYPTLRDAIVGAQVIDPRNPANDGQWAAGAHLVGGPSNLYGTAVAVFVLSIPNRYLPILQEGEVDAAQDGAANRSAAGVSRGAAAVWAGGPR